MPSVTRKRFGGGFRLVSETVWRDTGPGDGNLFFTGFSGGIIPYCHDHCGRWRSGAGSGSMLSGICGRPSVSWCGALLYAAEKGKWLSDPVKGDPEEIARRAKFMVVSYPNNPTAVMAPDSFYEELVAFAKKI